MDLLNQPRKRSTRSAPLCGTSEPTKKSKDTPLPLLAGRPDLWAPLAPIGGGVLSNVAEPTKKGCPFCKWKPTVHLRLARLSKNWLDHENYRKLSIFNGWIEGLEHTHVHWGLLFADKIAGFCQGDRLGVFPPTCPFLYGATPLTMVGGHETPATICPPKVSRAKVDSKFPLFAQVKGIGSCAIYFTQL